MNIRHKVLLLLGLCFISCGSLLAIDCPVGDFNGDCSIDIEDLVILADKWLYLGWSCPEPGISAAWKLDETAGNDVPDLADLHPGITVGDPIWRPFSGHQAGALELDGVDDYITIPGYKGVTGAGPRTCAAWINTHDAIGDILSWGSSAAGQLWRMRVFTETTVRQLRVGVIGGYIMSSMPIPTDQWVHIAAVLPAGKTNIQDVVLYINGLADTAATFGPVAINTGDATDVLIGYDGSAEYFQGLLDDIRIYDRGLTADEIWAVYLTGSSVQGCVDINGDGAVNITDLAPVSSNWLKAFGPVVISEFLADNDSKAPLTDGEILDGNGESSDWIELYNPSGATVNLEGWSLTDNATTRRLWTFPEGAKIDSEQYLIVFASKKEQPSYPTNYPYKDSKGYWHTNFKLDTAGEYLALTAPTGRTATEFESYEFAPGQFGYPPQKKNISYGLFMMDLDRYFSVLTPGKVNDGEFPGIVADTKFSVDRGFYSEPFLLEITSDPKVVKDAIIRYTTDGSTPSATAGKIYTGPITISKTTCVRAMASKTGYQSTGVDTHTYLFVKDIITQSENPADLGSGWPYSGVNGQTFNYGMDTKVTGVEPWKSQMAAAIVAIPSVSIVTDLKNLFDSGIGIYVNALQDGSLWERPCSMELIYPDGTEGFQINAGIRIRGGYSRGSDNPKHAFRMFFSGEYDGNLEYPLFGDEGAKKFEKVDLACPQNYSWSYGGDPKNTFCRDVFSRDTQGAMGQPYSKTRYYHLYIDGVYWGVYYTDERTEDYYGETYLGGDELDYDVMKVAGSRGESYNVYATNGNTDAYQRLWTAATAGFATDDAYYRVQGLKPDGTPNAAYERLLDEDNVIDYMICTYYVGDFDGPVSNFLGNGRPNNFYGMYNRVTPDGWKFFRHDAEHSLFPGWDRTGPWPAGSEFQYFNPQWLHQQLTTNANYRLRFADRVHRYFFNGGILTPQASIDRWMNRANQIQLAIIGESARWGDSKTGYPLTKDNWLAEINNVKNNYFPGRTNEVLNQLKNKGWYPNQAAPVFGQNGGQVEPGTALTMTGPAGTTTYYTLDGTDPRVFFSTDPAVTMTLVAESATKKVIIPTSTTGTTWTGANEPYNDAGWTAGTPIVAGKTGGAGYDRKTTKTYTPYISYNIESAMYNFNPSALIRIPFTVQAADLPRFQTLDLTIRYDDGFVAYLNGTVVATRNFTGTPQWNSVASASHDGRTAETINLASFRTSLKAGTNILAIHGMTRVSSSNNNDFLISAELTANRTGTPTGSVSPTAIPYTVPVVLTKSCQVKARTCSGDTVKTWSALQEATFSVGPVRENLVISEVMYHPEVDPNSEFVELYNVGSESLDLSLVRFEKGIDFTFGLTPTTTTIAPNGYMVLAKNPAVFAARYPAVPVAGAYLGALDSNGERIRLVDAIGEPIADFAYSNNWFDITDGGGFSLTLRSPRWDPPAITTEGLVSLWRMDETAGTAVSDSQGAHPGQTVNMDNSNWVSGRLDNGLQFDGINEFVTIPGYKGILGGASRTVSLWIQTTDRTGGQLVGWGVDAQGQKWVVRLETIEASHTVLRVEVWGAPIVGTTDLADGQWHHVAATLADDGSPDVSEVVLYVDGRREAISLAGQQAIDTAAGDDVRLGVFTTPYFRGRMDHVAIYNRALTDAEIAPMYQSRPLWDDKSYWRPSAAKDGSPGTGDGGIVPELGSVVINEVLSHSHGTDPDWIELHNTTDQPIPIGGWFLSDNNASEPNRMSYKIPAGTVIPRNGFVVFYENTSFNKPGAPGCRIPFSLSEGGESLYLQSGSGGQLTGYYTDENFGAAESGVSFGRYLKSTLDGGYNFVAMSSLTPNDENSAPKVGPIVITEIHYNPGTKPYDWDKEYIELKNISGSAVTLQWYDDVNKVTVPWKFTDGIQFTFPLGTTIGVGKRVLMAKNETALRAAFPTIPAGVPVFVWESGSLDNAGEKIELSRPGDQESGKARYYIRMERVNYNNASPWPGADGTGKSLTRIADGLYGNDAANWQAATPSPGQ